MSDIKETPYFETSWQAPSNIALVKYWGKKEGIQIPANPSVSLTLSEAHTKARLSAYEGEGDIDLFFEGQKMPSFLPKIKKFFGFVEQHLPWLKDFHFKLETSNSFPHSAGIASSASSMAAMALCLVDLEEKVIGKKREDFFERASFFARLGSGSACRSLFAHAASWGEALAPKAYSHHSFIDESATAIKIHERFENMHDSIFVVSKREKKVSSRAGHGLMDNNPYKEARFRHALENWNYCLEWLESGQWNLLGSLVEEEALTLHAMMMASRPGYLLMEPETITMIHRLREFRARTETEIYFTLDAGPNLHLLYPHDQREKSWEFIQECVAEFKGDAFVIDDQVGLGPVKGCTL